ncbi:MAG: hypothetical protein KKD17_05590, partial [Nanoarchaeota archaeon]|nr:hypothetical protein [Nanoarchaeota archaeon]
DHVLAVICMKNDGRIAELLKNNPELSRVFGGNALKEFAGVLDNIEDDDFSFFIAHIDNIKELMDCCKFELNDTINVLHKLASYEPADSSSFSVKLNLRVRWFIGVQELWSDKSFSADQIVEKALNVYNDQIYFNILSSGRRILKKLASEKIITIEEFERFILPTARSRIAPPPDVIAFILGCVLVDEKSRKKINYSVKRNRLVRSDELTQVMIDYQSRSFCSNFLYCLNDVLSNPAENAIDWKIIMRIFEMPIDISKIREFWFNLFGNVKGRNNIGKLYSLFGRFKTQEVLDFLELLEKSEIPKQDEPERDLMLDVLFKYVTYSKDMFADRYEKGISLLPGFFVKEIDAGRKAEEINVKEFHKYVKILDKNILGSFKIGEIVTLNGEDNKYMYRVIRITPAGHVVEDIAAEGKGEQKGPFRADEIKIFEETQDWKSIRQIRSKGFLIIHATNAFIKSRTPFENIESDLAGGEKYTISCSSISPLYNAGIAIKGEYAVGDVLSEGKIYAAFASDAFTVDVPDTSLFRTHTRGDKIPVRLALTSEHDYNELLPQNWKMDGVFYTLKTPSEDIEMLKQICIKQGICLYQIDENTKHWKVYEYNKSIKSFVLTGDTSKNEHIIHKAA